ncbi:DNA polymerase III subunit alpha [Boudabousia liubingyangii]|uniref:DNA polymerase III subunit alpha n=1 Tax=Boudabousia liubingyangii TaxID=1921764 RepID=A0A1Q5PN73_9ACTO|nr:DNA polymerase III subunit alpha [Boudabousia liubingyangii]OKL47553.1 DNA polymerase III subunit alpha [Boudabousia liubingyangii]OKL48977.1 DNA polymerase III subunit alpha [Boudabousia liubingyangii]
MESNFVHLHCHTDYSMLDGAARIKPMVERAKELGQPAVAITDHGFLFGAFEFYSACKDAGIKPIIGLEAYMTPGTSRFDNSRVLWGTKEQQSAGDDVSARGSYTHMTLLSRTTEGMHNLFRLGSLASLEGHFGKAPRADRDLLETYSKGLIGTTGCPSSAVQTRLRLGQIEEAYKEAGELQDIFGKENFFVELMDHGLSIERRVQKELLALARHLDAPIIATNDSHYVSKDERDIHDSMLCISTGSRLSDPDRFRFEGSGYYLKTAQEMREIFKELPEACDNTLLVAQMCDVEFTTTKEGANFMPQFPVPEGEDEHSWFIREVERGLHYRFPNGIPDEVRKQADYEVGIITQMGFPGYFLVVADYIQWAKDQGIRVGPGRGSGAGSMVAYAMRITELNPLEHGLLFERFLNPERVSMPDFDIDFDERRRGEVIDYVTRKYGSDKIAQVVTYGKIKSKQALKDSTRVLGYEYQMGERLTKAMPPSVMGKDIPVNGIFDPTHKRYAEAEEFRKLHASDPDVQKVVGLAKGLEGLTRQWGVHACAVIMSSHTLTDIIPLMKRPQDGAIITQFEYPTCEALGLLKMDFLGLRNLTVISDALEAIVDNGKEPVDLDHLTLDDRATYELLSTGETLGVFQMDGGGMRELLRLMKPDNFEDISAVGALYRPGPMGADSHTNYALRKNGIQAIEPIHPALEEPLKDILGETYGLIVYQEQVMAIAQKVAGYSLGQADLLRRAMGKKKKEILDKEYIPFHDGMIERGYPEDAIKTLWDILVPFSNYAFNKAHSAAYGVVSYWTAYLKANYPVEYMSALLTSQRDNKDKLSNYLAECRRMHINVLPPDVNESDALFSAVGEDIRFGLAAIRNVGHNVVEAIIEARQEKGPFTSFKDFLSKVPMVVCNKRTIDSLIKAGAFDSLEESRAALSACHEEAVDAVTSQKRNEAIGQFDLFAAFDTPVDDAFTFAIPNLPEWDRKIKLQFERDMLGLYVSDHPLNGLERTLARNADAPITHVIGEGGTPDRGTVRISGLITSVVRKTNKQGALWAIVTIEDLSGSMQVLFFPRTFETYSPFLEPDALVSITGNMRRDDAKAEIYATDMKVLEVSETGELPLVLNLGVRQCTRANMEALRDVLETHPGSSPVRLKVKEGPKVTTLELDKTTVEQSTALFADILAILGSGVLPAEHANN